MATTLTQSSASGALDKDMALSDYGGKYLTFALADEQYGVEIMKVREIMGFLDITAVPRMPTYMKGVINLRGKVVPVVDLRIKFGLPEVERTQETCIIVVDVGKEVGIVVDTVCEVLDIDGGNIEPPPSMGGAVNTSFILGMGKVVDAVTMLLNIDKVLAAEELDTVTASVPTDETAASTDADAAK